MARKFASAFTVFQEMRLKCECTDAAIRVQDTVFKVHKVVMCCCSPYFRALLSSRWCSDAKPYDIPGVSPVMMSLIIQYGYTGHVDITEENVQELLVAADQFLVLGLVDACCQFLESQLSPENCMGIHMFTEDLYNCVKLHREANHYILMNFEEVLHVSEEFPELSLEHLVKFIGEDELNVKQEEIVFEAVVQWINHKPEERRKHIAMLLPKVRMGFMSSDYFTSHVKDHPLVMWNESCTPVIISAMKALFHVDIGRPSSPELIAQLTRSRLPPAILMAIGGWSGQSPTNEIEVYDVRADRWVDVTDVDASPRAYHGSVMLDGYIYCIGGFDSIDYFNSVRKFNPITLTWHEVAPMYEQRCYVSVAELDGYIYAIGGHNGQERLKTAERYDPQSNQWTQIASVSECRSDSNATSLHGKVYICGGFSGRQCLFTAECFDPETNQWSLIAPMMTRRSGVRVAAYGDLVYAVGGFDGVSRLRSVEAYNPRTNTWHGVQSMNQPRSNFGIAVLDDRIFAIGGFNGSGTFGEVECYDPQTDLWSMVSRMSISRSALSCCVSPYVTHYAAKRDSVYMEELKPVNK